MRSSRPARFVPVLAAVVACLAASQTASAVPPGDQDPLRANVCTAAAPDTGGAHICWVTPLRGGFQASTGEWIIVRVGEALDIDPANPGAAQLQREQLQASIVSTNTIDGTSLPVDTIPCVLRHSSDPAFPDVWFVDWRALSRPLTPGEHTFSVSWFFMTTVPGVAMAGDTFTFPTRTLTVMPQG